MKLITKHTDYAARALMYLAGHADAVVSSREIAEKERIPLRFIRVILQGLKRQGIIAAKEGVRGGVWLKVLPEKIRLVDLIRMFQGEVQLSECMFRNKVCANRKACVLRRRIQAIEQTVIDEFRRITIADLLSEPRRKTCQA